MVRVWNCNSVLLSIDLCCVCCNAESYAPSPNNGTETMTPWKRVSSAKQTNPNLALYSIVCCSALCFRPVETRVQTPSGAEALGFSAANCYCVLGQG